MKFTADDLKRLKDAMNSEGKPIGWSYGYNPAQIRALLARFEAETVICEEFEKFFRERPGLRYDKVVELLKAWRESKGEK